MGKVIDLDALSAARAEVRKDEAPTVRFSGRDFQLPYELPFAVIEAISRLQKAQEKDDNALAADVIIDVSRALFGADFQAFLDLRPSMQDVSTLLENVSSAYGMSMGESEASGN